MASHDPHPEISEHGLADGCERCGELAEHPLELDPENFTMAWERMLAVEWADSSYRSANEARLGRLLYTWAVFLERYTPIDPRELPEQMRARA